MSPRRLATPRSPTHDDDDLAIVDSLFDRVGAGGGGIGVDRQPTVLRLTTFKPSSSPPPGRETAADDSAGQPAAADVDRAGEVAVTVPTSLGGVVGANSDVLDKLQPDLLPLISSTTAVADDAALPHGPDELSQVDQMSLSLRRD